MSSNNLCIHHLIEHQVERTPEKIAVQFEGVALTYRELNARANRLAHFLIAQNIRPDEVVGLQMGRSLDLMVALLGVLKAGAAYVPLDPQYPADRLEYMRADSGARISFTPEDFGSQWEDESDQNPEVPDLFSHNLAHVLYTSGSTGRPKGVEIEHASVVNFIHSLIGILDFSQDEVVVGVTGLTFDIAGLDMYCAWSTGATLILVTRRTVFNGDLLKQALGEHRATLLQTTPITWRALFDAGWTAPEGFKMLCGGEKLPLPLLKDFARQKGRVWNLYGPTETTIWSTAHEITPQDFATGQIVVGRPIANTAIAIVDENLALVPDGEVGEVLIAGEGLARGYRNQPSLTLDKFLSTPGGGRRYRTGDRGRMVHGQCEILGRVDHQIKYHGYRIEPGEIETAICELTGIKECVVALANVGGHDEIIAYLTGTIDPGRLRADLLTLLPTYMVPSHFMTIPFFPQTPTGKVDRKSLPRIPLEVSQ